MQGLLVKIPMDARSMLLIITKGLDLAYWRLVLSVLLEAFILFNA